MSCRTRPTFVDSTYYPPGWDQQRLIEASSSELRALPSEQFDNMRNGMVEKMGKERFQEFLQWLIVGEGLKNPTKAVAEGMQRLVSFPIPNRPPMTEHVLELSCVQRLSTLYSHNVTSCNPTYRT